MRKTRNEHRNNAANKSSVKYNQYLEIAAPAPIAAKKRMFDPASTQHQHMWQYVEIAASAADAE